MLARVNVLAHCWDTVTEFGQWLSARMVIPASSSDDSPREAMGLEHGSMPSDLGHRDEVWTVALVLMVIPLLVAVVTPL